MAIQRGSLLKKAKSFFEREIKTIDLEKLYGKITWNRKIDLKRRKYDLYQRTNRIFKEF